MHHNLHLRRDGDAAVREGLREQRVRVGRLCHAEVELHGLHAQLHDCLPCAVWRVDRVNVGLHLRQWQGLHPLLHGHCPGWKSRHPQSFPCFAAFKFL